MELKLLSNKHFPEIPRVHRIAIVIAIPSWATYWHKQVIRRPCKSRVIVQPVFNLVVAPFSNFIRIIFFTPFCANACKLRIVIFHSLKRTTGGRLGICLTAEILHYSFTRAVSCRDHVERTTKMSFPAMESHLSEAQMSSQLVHCSFFFQDSLVNAYSTVRCLNWDRRWRWAFKHHAGDQQPAS